ncbi:MAG: HD-GYP domain-containing protein [bacterium]
MSENQENSQETQEQETASPQTEIKTEESLNGDIPENNNETAQETETVQEQPVSEKIKSLNAILNFVSINKPIIFDKAFKTGMVGMSIFGLLKMESDVVKIGNNNEIRLDSEDLVVASYMANIGFIGVPEYILYKQGQLTDGEYDTVKQHVKLSANAASSVSQTAYAAILDHHELPLGKGYNKKMTGIPRSAYVIGIADRFVGSVHMMGSLYRPANSRYDAVSNAISMFDNTSQVFSIDEINAIADLLLTINV